MNKKTMVLILSVLLYNVIFSQEVAHNKYWIQFSDKNGSEYSVFSPDEFLSAKAIERRQRFNIQIDKRDLPINKRYIDKVEQLGARVLNVSKWFNAIVVEAPSAEFIEQTKKLPFVKSFNFKTNELRPAHYNPLVHELSEYKTGNYTVWNNNIIKIKKTGETHNRFEYGAALNQIEMLAGCDLHNLGYAGKGMTIAVIDAGFYHVHKLPMFKKLWENGQILGMRDFVDGDTTVFDASYHGMKALSTMGGNLTGKMVGTAPEANFWLLRSEDANSENIIEEANWIAAAEYADSLGVDVITTSLGYNDFDINEQNYSTIDLDGRSARMSVASNIAAAKGMLIITSAGNTGFEHWQLVTIPADADSVISVGSVDRFEEYSYFSAKGPTADNRVKPNVVARGSSTAVQDPSGRIGYSSGTSFSGPVLAGMASSLWQAHKGFTPTQMINVINSCGADYSCSRIQISYQSFCQAFPNPYCSYRAGGCGSYHIG